MEKIIHHYGWLAFLALMLIATGCERDFADLEPATFPTNGDVFIDGFTGGLDSYDAFGGSDVTAFNVDNEVTYQGNAAMRFAVPDEGAPLGSYAGGAFILDSGRDLSGYNVLSFWARASEAVTISEFGFGNDFGDNAFVANIMEIPVTANWQKYYVPIPAPSRLTQERGLFYYVATPEEGRGYSLWVDELKFETVGTVRAVGASIFDGEDQVVSAETGAVYNAGGTAIFSLPTGVNQTVNAASAYFTYESSNPDVAAVQPSGEVVIVAAGEAVITATLGDIPATGSLTVTSSGAPVGPTSAAPIPEAPADEVVSIFSDAYQDVPVDFYNGFWEFSTTQSADFMVTGDNIIRYSQLNFVGIQFTSPTIDITGQNRIHIDVWTPDNTDAPNEFKILLVDLGPDNSFGGDDDSSHEVTIPASDLQSEEWISIDLPLSTFPGLTSRANLAQVVLSGGGGGGDDDEPAVAAPAPNRSASDVISLFSDAYDDVVVDTWRTDWSVANFEDVTVAGNATKKYSALDFVGIETVMNQVDVTGMTHFHVDAWSGDATSFSVKLVDFGPDGGFDGGDDTEFQIDYPAPAQNQWVSYDIPLSDFTDLMNRENIAQLIFVAQPSGAATVFLDNIYFYDEDGGGGGNDNEPGTAAPTPNDPAGNVGNATKQYTELDFVGIETVANQVDATGMTHFRIDVWTPDATSFSVKLVDFGADGAFGGGDDVEHQIDFAAPAQGQWISYDIPLSDFTGLTTRENIAQLILVGQPTGAATVFVDNVYFRN